VLARCYNAKSTSDSTELVERLAFHRPTASYLVGYNSSQDKLPFRPSRFQYVAKIVAAGRNPDELLDNIRDVYSIQHNGTASSWTISYDIFEPLNPKVSSTMLMCAISRFLSGEPLLTYDGLSSKESDLLSYLVIETSSHIYLAEKLDQTKKDEIEKEHLTNTRGFSDMWSKRPFQYSGAINLDLAITIIDILKDALQLEKDISLSQRTIRLIDPTCGSGTFLALTVIAWSNLVNLELTGVDSNPKCASGTTSNLMKAFSIDDKSLICDDVRKQWTVKFPPQNSFMNTNATILNEDSTLLHATNFTELFDCAVTNLPWNRNTFEFKQSAECKDVNRDILKSVASVLKPRAPIVVVSASVDSTNKTYVFDPQICLKDLGFEVLGFVSVPPTGFVLPGSKKISKNNSSNRLKGSSNCSILLALAP
jgi:hypothetical protein